MIKLGVNVDHVATIRQARMTYEPDPVTAAGLADLGGADIITIHLREDRRHIQDRDLELLRGTVFTKLNLEMATSQEIVDIALKIKPRQITLVPEKRQEITTEGGLPVTWHVHIGSFNFSGGPQTTKTSSNQPSWELQSNPKIQVMRNVNHGNVFRSGFREKFDQ